MSKDIRHILVRVGVVAVVIVVGAVALLWRTWSVRDLTEIEPNVLSRATVTNEDELVATMLKASPQGLMLIGSGDEQHSPLYVAAHDYGFRNHLRVWEIYVGTGQLPTTEDLDRVREYLGREKNKPALLVSSDATRGGMLAAAYRLSVMKMPLSEVQRLAETESKDPAVALAIRNFTEQWAKAPIRPATKPVKEEEKPAGPLLPPGQ